MAFPTTTLLDDFNRGTASTLGANWSNDPNGVGDGRKCSVATNAATNDGTASFGDSWWNVAQYGPDIEAYVDVARTPTARIMLRFITTGIGTSGMRGYELDVNFATSPATWTIYRRDASSVSLTSTTQTTVSGDGIGAERIGSTLTMYRRASGVWSSVISTSDATYTGVCYITLSIQEVVDPGVADNFSGGTVVAGPPTPIAFRRS